MRLLGRTQDFVTITLIDTFRFAAVSIINNSLYIWSSPWKSGTSFLVKDKWNIWQSFLFLENELTWPPLSWCYLSNKKYPLLICFVIFSIDVYLFFANFIVLVLSSFCRISLRFQSYSSIKYYDPLFFGIPSEIATQCSMPKCHYQSRMSSHIRIHRMYSILMPVDISTIICSLY